MEKKIISKQVFSMLLLYYVSVFISDSLPAGQLLTALPLAFMIIIALKVNRRVVKIQPIGYFIYIALFTAFCALSRLWAENSKLAVTKINSLLFVFIAMIVIVMCLYQKQDVEMLLKVIMYGGYCVCLYIIIRYGLSGVIRMLKDSSRLTNEVINANAIGLCAAYSIVINIQYIFYRKFMALDLLIIPAFLLLAVSGSRKAILAVIVGTFGLIILKNLNQERFLKKVAKVLLIIIGLSLLCFLLSRLAFFSVIVNRISNLINLLQGNETRGSSDAWIRLAYNRLGMELFKEHPLLGIGIANANIYTNAMYGHNHYLHNNYIELLACGGLVGFLIYYSAWIYLLITFVKCRKQRSPKYDICLVLLVIHMIMDYGKVSYYVKDTYVFLLLFWIEAKKLKMEMKTKSRSMSDARDDKPQTGLCK